MAVARRPVHVPGREERRLSAGRGRHVERSSAREQAIMITRGEIIWLGVSAGVTGSLVGGMMLGIGMDLIVNGRPLGWLLLLPAAPVAAVPGWLLARKLAKQI